MAGNYFLSVIKDICAFLRTIQSAQSCSKNDSTHPSSLLFLASEMFSFEL